MCLSGVLCLATGAARTATAEEFSQARSPKSANSAEGHLPFAKASRVVYQEEAARGATELRADELAHLTGMVARTVIDASRPGNVSVRLEPAQTSNCDNPCPVAVTDRVVLSRAAARSPGISTMVQLVKVHNGQAAWPRVTIEEGWT